jgi:uncharacterized membrane-anchored protein YitT (DUF2179 family)
MARNKIHKVRRKQKRLTFKQARILAADQLFYLLGCLCYAAALNMLAVPNQIVQSGVSGLAIIVNRLLHTPIGINNLILNIPLLALALIFVGWKFVSKTLWVTVELSVIIDLMGRYVTFTYTEDRLLATFLCGALSGLGLALILMRGATSGGTDIVGWLARKWQPHLSLGRVILLADTLVVLAGAAVFHDISSALYAAIMIFISTRVIDSMLYGMNNGKVFYIFSRRADEIAEAILEQLGRGVTLLPARGAFTGERRDMLLCVVRRSEVSPLRRLLKALDPQSFFVIAEAQEIFGEGFRRH